MTADRTDQLLDLLYGECSPDEAEALRRAIDEDEALAKEWERLVADREAVQEHMTRTPEMPDEVHASILDRASQQAAATKGAHGDDHASSLPWMGMAAAAVALLAAGAAYYLVVQLGAAPQTDMLEPPPTEVAEPMHDEAPPPAATAQAQDQAQAQEEEESPGEELLEASEEAIASAQEQAEEQAEEAQAQIIAQLQDRTTETEDRGATDSDEAPPSRSTRPHPRPQASPPSQEPTAEEAPASDDVQAFEIGGSPMADDDGAPHLGRSADLGARSEAEDPDETGDAEGRLDKIRQLVNEGQTTEAREQLEELLDSDDADELDQTLRQNAEALLRRLQE